nr:alpha/beta hydrolase [Duganella sp. SG902]
MQELMKTISVMLCALAAFVLSGCAVTSQGEYTSRWSKDAPRYTQLDEGVTMRYTRAGDGPPLILLHTIRTQLDYFEKLAPALQGQYQVYALDLPGHGQSSLPQVEYTEAFLRKAVAQFIVKQDLKNVTLVGESIGGVLALTVSTELPDRVSRVIALNPYDYGEDFGGGIRRSESGWMIGLFNLFGSHTFEPRFVTASVLNGGFHDPSRLPPALLTEFSRTGYRDGYRKVEYSVFKNWTSWVEARALYQRVTVPTTLVYGDEDWSNAQERERNRQAIPNAKLIVLEKSGHFTALEKPDEVASIVLKRP